MPTQGFTICGWEQVFIAVHKALGIESTDASDVIEEIKITRKTLDEFSASIGKRARERAQISTALGIESTDIADVLEKIEELHLFAHS